MRNGALADWEILAKTPRATARRRGRFLAVDLLEAHTVISTSTKNGGQTAHVRYLLNHQGCEPSGHDIYHKHLNALGEDGYHDAMCREADTVPAETASMGTAANMNYAAVVTRADQDASVVAIVTAGVETNATCAGDPAHWREFITAEEKTFQPAGTINTILLIGRPVTVAALARAIVVMTEAKSAALQYLAVPSCQSADLATGTGTDQFCLAAPVAGASPITSASPHSKFGELIGAAIRDATLEALRWQNGLERSITRGLFHALRRYGVKEPLLMERLALLLDAEDFELLRRNANAVFYEPLVGAAAHALAAVLDRIRHGTLPASCARDAVGQQAANLAVSLAGKPNRWPEYRDRLCTGETQEPLPLVASAIALGWSEKWRRA